LELKRSSDQLTDLLVKNNVFNDTSFILTDLMRVTISNFTEDKMRYINDYSLANKISLIDFDACIVYLREIGSLGNNETIQFKKIDWDSKLNIDNDKNNTNISSVSYSLFTSNGTKFDLNLCYLNKTSIEIYVGDNNYLKQVTLSPEMDVFNPNSPYFIDRCVPLLENDTEFTINERRKTYSGLEIQCSEGCVYLGVNITTFYTKCSCNTTDDEMYADFSKTLLKAITSSNFFIIQCYYNFNVDLVI